MKKGFAKVTELVDEGGGNIVEKNKWHSHFVPNFLMVVKPPPRRPKKPEVDEDGNVKKAKDVYGVTDGVRVKPEVHLLSGYAGKEESEDQEE